MAETPQKCKPSGLSSSQVLLHDPSRNTKLHFQSKKIQELQLNSSRNQTQNMLPTTELAIKLNICVSIIKKKCKGSSQVPWLQNDREGETVSTQTLLSLPQGSQQGKPFPTGCCAAAGAWPVFHLSQSENSGVSGGRGWMQKSGGSTPAHWKEFSQSFLSWHPSTKDQRPLEMMCLKRTKTAWFLLATHFSSPPLISHYP